MKCMSCSQEVKAFTSIKRHEHDSLQTFCRHCAHPFIEPNERKALARIDAGENLVPVRCAWQAKVFEEAGFELGSDALSARCDEVAKALREEVAAEGAFRLETRMQEIRWANPPKYANVTIFYHVVVPPETAHELEAIARGIQQANMPPAQGKN